MLPQLRIQAIALSSTPEICNLTIIYTIHTLNGIIVNTLENVFYIILVSVKIYICNYYMLRF